MPYQSSPMGPLENATTQILNNVASSSQDFRRNFRSLVDWHKPPLVALLETKMQDHLLLLNDFPYNKIIEVPAVGNVGGLAVMWDDSLLDLDEVATTNQEIHTIVKDLLRELGKSLVHHEDRGINKVLDILAKEGRKKEVHQFFEQWAVLPMFIRKVITIDKEGSSFTGWSIDINPSVIQKGARSFMVWDAHHGQDPSSGYDKLGIRAWFLFWRNRDGVIRYVDSDFVGDHDKRSSLIDYVFTIGGCAISWKITLQTTVALSTIEAEYMAITEAFKEVIWLKGIKSIDLIPEPTTDPGGDTGAMPPRLGWGEDGAGRGMGAGGGVGKGWTGLVRCEGVGTGTGTGLGGVERLGWGRMGLGRV
ncbi:hypothetical protein FXO38_07225 [Capsicum annuum]|nr:hypothetical protein FXO37_09251 [Capsicum annuum]KAF3670150.1 hypothetical protein FXO38_07225 [Capsicum annuum]